MANWCVLNRKSRFLLELPQDDLIWEQARRHYALKSGCKKARPTSLIFGRCWQRRKKA